jgi:outer membrane protein TolC
MNTQYIHTAMAVVASAMLCCHSLQAADAPTLSLEQCRQLALQQNVTVTNADLSLNAANESARQALTGYFPSVSASGMAYNANKGLIEMDMGPDMQMSMLKNGVMGGVTLTQPIFAGGQIVNSNRLAKVGVQVAGLQQEQARKQVLATVEQYYWQLVTLIEKKHTLTTVAEMLDQIHSEVDNAVKAGMTTRNDLLQVQLRQNDIEASMLNLDNNIQLLRMTLAQYIGMNGSEVNVVTDDDISKGQVPVFPAELAVDYSQALLNTPEYKLLGANTDAARLQQKIEVGKNLPTVGAGVGYMYDNLTDKSHPFGVAFVSVSVPISGWWGGSHAIKREKAKVAMAENTLSDTSDLLVINMQRLWNDVQDSHRQIGIAYKSIEQSTENLRLERNYYAAGMCTMSDLLDAQMLYQQSRDKMIEATARFYVAVMQYRQATAQDTYQ